MGSRSGLQYSQVSSLQPRPQNTVGSQISICSRSAPLICLTGLLGRCPDENQLELRLLSLCWPGCLRTLKVPSVHFSSLLNQVSLGTADSLSPATHFDQSVRYPDLEQIMALLHLHWPSWCKSSLNRI